MMVGLNEVYSGFHPTVFHATIDDLSSSVIRICVHADRPVLAI